MNTFFHIAGTASLSLAVAPATLAAPVWEIDFNKGLETARDGNRTVMVEFTGSDWCPPCKYLRSTILDSPEFANYAERNKLVLVELDFPRTPGKISKELMKEREDIMRRYGVTGFPTVMLMDGTGAPYARIVGPTKTAPEYLEKLTKAQDLKKLLNGKLPLPGSSPAANGLPPWRRLWKKCPRNCRDTTRN
ncbi:MAG: thioredoxin family protein [Akkermansia sp.]